jgi:hypothetical protein
MPANRALCLEKYDSTHQTDMAGFIKDMRAGLQGLDQKIADQQRQTEEFQVKTKVRPLLLWPAA